jgi:hypothetical protein
MTLLVAVIPASCAETMVWDNAGVAVRAASAPSGRNQAGVARVSRRNRDNAWFRIMIVVPLGLRASAGMAWTRFAAEPALLSPKLPQFTS